MSKLSKDLIEFVLLGHTPLEALRLAGGFLLSIGAHAAAAIVLMLLPMLDWLDNEPIPPIEMEIVEPEREIVPEPEPEPEPEPPSEPELPAPEPVVQRPTPTRTPPPPSDEPPPTEDPPPAEETVADFSGMTLTNDQGAAWNSATGDGAAMDGPVGRPGAQVTGRNRRGQQGGTPGGQGTNEEADQLVPPSDLSRRPGPPASRLRELLRANYPREARNLGLEGSARVRIRVEPDGRVRVLGVVSEEHDGFGQACRATLREGGRWEPPLDRSGDAVATITTFRCTFSVDF